MITLAQHNFLKHIAALKERLASMLWHHYNAHSPLENAFCALVIRLMPQRKIRNLYDALPYRTVGMTLMDLLNTMANLGFAYHSVGTTLAGVDTRLLPCLFLDKRERQDWPDRPVVLLERDDTENKLVVYDCAKKQLVEVALDGEAAAVAGRGYVFVPLSDERRATSGFMRGQTGFTWFRALLTRFYPLFWQVLLTGLFLHVIALAMPLFIMLVYDKVISSHAPQTLYYLLPGVMLALIFEVVFRRIRSGALAWLATRLDVIVTTGVFAHFVKLPSAVIGQTAISSQVARIKAFEYVRDFFSGPVFLSVLDIPFTLLAVGVIALLAGPLVAVPLAGVLAFLILFYVMWRPVKLHLKMAAKATSVRQQFTLEMMEKMEALQQQGLGQVWHEKFRMLSGREYAAHFKLGFYGSLAEILAHSLTLVCAMAVLGMGTHAVWDGHMTVGGLLCTMILVWRVLTPFYSLCTMIPRLEQLRQSVRQVNQLMETSLEQHEHKARSRSLRGSLKLENVSFAYEGNPMRVVENLDLEIEAGQVVMVTGRSGSGRSTLLKLLLGLYLPSYGTLRLDGADLHQLDLADLRRQIAYVPQVPDFFEGTILENLQLAKPAAREAELWEALRMADAEESVQLMPGKLETMIASDGEDRMNHALGYKLSLARAYLKNANLLLIDELPGAMLNGPAGENLRAYLQDGKGRRTVLMVCDQAEFAHVADQFVSLGRAATLNSEFNPTERLRDAAAAV